MLEVHGLDAWYGPAQALFGVSLSLRAGELVVLQGLNGAGKSTLLQSIIGIGPRAEGAIEFDGHTIGSWPAHRRVRAGIGYVAEDRRLFAALTVEENLDIAAADASDAKAQALALFPALKTMLARKAHRMSGGEQQMLAIARTLASGPRLLLLDEPCEGIAPVLVAAIRDALLALRRQGTTMLVAEQNHLLADHADRVLQMNSGRLLGGRPESHDLEKGPAA